MAKLAVVFFAAFAFHAVFGGVIKPYQYTNTIQELPNYGSPLKNLPWNTFPGQETTQELVMQIEQSTFNLIQLFRGSYINVDQMRIALREYAQRLQTIVETLQSIQLPPYVNSIVKTKIQEITIQLRLIASNVMQFVNIETVQNVDVLKTQLCRNWEIIAQELKQLVNCPEQTVVQNILYKYLTAVEQLRMQIQKPSPVQLFVNYPQPQLTTNTMSRVSAALSERQYAPKAITSVINDITKVVQSIYLDNVPLRQTITLQLLEYIQTISTIVEKLNQVQYQETMQLNTIQPVVSNLKEILVSLQRICENNVPFMPVQQWKNQISMYLQSFARELQNLPTGAPDSFLETQAQYYNTINNAFNQILLVSRNLQLQLLNFFYYPQQEHTPVWYGIQFQTLANSLATTLKSAHPENLEAKRFLTLQCRKFAQQLEYIVNRLQVETTYNIKYGVPVNTQITNNLQQIVNTLQRLAMTETFTDLNQLKMQIVNCVQEAATEVQKLLWARQNYPQERLDTVLDEVCKQFLATLRNYQIEMQSLFLTKQYGQNVPQMVNQIQIMTNRLAVFLQNAPFQAKDVDTQVRRLVEFLNFVIDILETEVVYQSKSTSVNQTVQNLKEILVSIRRNTEWENTKFGLSYQLYMVLQNVAVEFKHLALMCETEVQIEESFIPVVRSIFAQYFVLLQRIQIDLQRISNIQQSGQAPAEISNYIQNVANRLYEILSSDEPSNMLTYQSMIWQVRRFNQLLANIINKLQVETPQTYEKVDNLQQVIFNINRIRLVLQRLIQTKETLDIQQFKEIVSTCVRDSANEIQKLMWLNQSTVDIKSDAWINNILIDYLTVLQDFQLQLQDDLQIVFGEQSPRSLVLQIQSVATRLFACVQRIRFQPPTQQLRQSLLIQVRQLAQTIENLLPMLRTEMKFNIENVNVLQEVVTQFTQEVFDLQKTNEMIVAVDINELCTRVMMHIQNLISGMERLALVAESKIADTKLSYKGVLNSAFNNCLATLCNIVIQLENTQQIDQYNLNVKQLANLIHTTTSKLTTTVENIHVTDKYIEQGLLIRLLKYTNRVQLLVNRLDSIYFGNQYSSNVFREVSIKMRQFLISIEQLGEALPTMTTLEIKNLFNSNIQNIDVECQKLLLIESKLENQESSETFVKSILFEYLTVLQNVQIDVEYVWKSTENRVTLPEMVIQTQRLVNFLLRFLQRLSPYNSLVKQLFPTETKQIINVVENIINKLQVSSEFENNLIFQKVSSQLKEIQIALQNNLNTKPYDVFQGVKRNILLGRDVANVIKELLWTAQPNMQCESCQIPFQASTSTISVVREIFVEFITVMQNWNLQVQMINFNEQPSEYRMQFNSLGRYLESYKPQSLLYPQELYQSPKSIINEVQAIVRDVATILQNPTISNTEIRKVLPLQARKFSQVIQMIIEMSKEQGIVQPTYLPLINRIREVQLTLQRLAVYNPFTNVDQVKTEFLNCMEVVLNELERLVPIARETTIGNVLTNVLKAFYQYVQSFSYELQTIVQNRENYPYTLQSQYGKYGYLSDFSRKYNTEYPQSEFEKYNTLLGGKHGYNVPVNYEQQNCQELMQQINSIVTKVIDELQLVKNEKQDKDQILMQARELLQIIDNVIDRVQGMIVIRQPISYTYIQQSISNLRQCQVELRRMVNTRVIITTYQIRPQFINTLQILVQEFQQLVNVIKNVPELSYVVKDILTQFYMYLRNICNQCQYGSYPVNYKFNPLLTQYPQSWRSYPSKYLEYNYYSRPSLSYEKYPSLYNYGPYQSEAAYENKYESPLNKYRFYNTNTFNKYGYRMPLEKKFELKDKTCEELVEKIEWVAKQVVNELEFVTNEKQVQNLLALQARQMIGVIDSIIEKLQVQIPTANPIVKLVVINLRQIQAQLRSIVTPETITPVHQIRTQFVNILENVVTEFQKLVSVVKSDLEVSYVVKDVLIRYLIYLRGMYYQCRRNLESMEITTPSTQLNWYNNVAVGDNLLSNFKNWLSQPITKYGLPKGLDTTMAALL